MSQTAKYVLRDLPGAAEFAALWASVQAHPNPNWAPGYERLRPTGKALAERWFGISEEGTYSDDIDDEGDAALREKVSLFRASAWLPGNAGDLDQAAAMGWDVSDGASGVHPVLGFVLRPLVCAALGLAGRLPDGPISDDEAAARATSWAASLEADAKNFHSKPRKGRDR